VLSTEPPYDDPFRPPLFVRDIDDDAERLAKLQQRFDRFISAQVDMWRRQQFRRCVMLFLLTLLSTFVVGAGYVPLTFLAAEFVPQFQQFLMLVFGPERLSEHYWEHTVRGLQYAIPLMSILLCHEMGHYLQAVRNHVPASLPYFIPMPLPPLGTMGAVIFQSRGAAGRRQMFDIAVSGPIAGLIVTLPVLWYGIRHSAFELPNASGPFAFGKPLLIQWMELAVHGPAPVGQTLVSHPLAFAGWVGVFITALNLLPVGQLDGGHILYTLIGRRAHVAAYLIIGAGMLMMWLQQDYSFTVLLLLLLISGPRHPPTANDHEPLGLGRHLLGWLTLSFLIIGFTPTPIITNSGPDRENRNAPQVPDQDEFVRLDRPSNHTSAFSGRATF
jgi:Zn-dependent protease